jgi:hypothetical protein
LYDDFEVSYSKAPLRRVNVIADVAWDQEAQGDIDLTERLCREFRQVGSSIVTPLISSFTGDGLKSSWPAPLASIGSGWSVGQQSTIVEANWIKTGRYAVKFVDKSPEAKTTQVSVATEGSNTFTFEAPKIPPIGHQFNADWKTYFINFDNTIFAISFIAHYEASRQRTETVSFSLEADVQSVLVEPGAAEQKTLTFHSDFISSAIDPDGSMPIGDLRSNTYFKTDRGQLSFQYIMMVARAELIAGARVVIIKFSTELRIATNLSCRKNIHLIDRRLPGGEAIGKITSYILKASDSGEFKAEITIECTVGYGNPISAREGSPVYSDDYDTDYEQFTGGQIEVLTGELAYQSFDDFVIIDDDGVDFFNMTPETCVIAAYVRGGASEQRSVIDAAVSPENVKPDPAGALALTPTRVFVQLVSLNGGPFASEYTVIVSKLVIPQTINLEAT